MERYLLQDHWATLVQEFKDSESLEGVSAYDAEKLARYVLDYAQNSRIRQYNLFTQQRGEEFERMYEYLKRMFTEASLKRFLENEELWKTTLEVAEQ